MTGAEMRELVVGAITEVAPDVDPLEVRGTDSLRVDLELDSIDFLAVVEKLAASTGVEIPEEDYDELATIDACAEYLARARSAG